MPSVVFKEGVILCRAPKSEEDREFAKRDLKKECRKRVFERVSGEGVEDKCKGSDSVLGF